VVGSPESSYYISEDRADFFLSHTVSTQTLSETLAFDKETHTKDAFLVDSGGNRGKEKLHSRRVEELALQVLENGDFSLIAPEERVAVERQLLDDYRRAPLNIQPPVAGTGGSSSQVFLNQEVTKNDIPNGGEVWQGLLLNSEDRLADLDLVPRLQHLFFSHLEEDSVDTAEVFDHDPQLITANGCVLVVDIVIGIQGEIYIGPPSDNAPIGGQDMNFVLATSGHNSETYRSSHGCSGVLSDLLRI
jgi:hypothetical protein